MIWRAGFFACAILIGYGSLSPSGGDIIHVWDKLQHFGAYWLLSLLGLAGWGHLRRGLPIVAATVIVYGGLIEIVQNFVGRDMSLADFVTDILGTGAAVLVWRVFPAVSADSGEHR